MIKLRARAIERTSLVCEGVGGIIYKGAITCRRPELSNNCRRKLRAALKDKNNAFLKISTKAWTKSIYSGDAGSRDDDECSSLACTRAP
ncbi:hypothetical protein EVAR_52000_1 [Eumeta japonica]|uniref:Uncharacterized protein n=1 Tax=Eumeta variegata TaxID=151549 RepID=A0A4C1Y3F8_EUMVA|nr:hypothetical protein EVAR_52000_1 [Eumeta japonica]